MKQIVKYGLLVLLLLPVFSAGGEITVRSVSSEAVLEMRSVRADEWQPAPAVLCDTDSGELTVDLTSYASGSKCYVLIHGFRKVVLTAKPTALSEQFFDYFSLPDTASYRIFGLHKIMV